MTDGYLPPDGGRGPALLVEDDRHRAVVLDREEHPRAEASGGDADLLGAKRRAEALDERLGGLGSGRVAKARSVPLRRLF